MRVFMDNAGGVVKWGCDEQASGRLPTFAPVGSRERRRTALVERGNVACMASCFDSPAIPLPVVPAPTCS